MGSNFGVWLHTPWYVSNEILHRDLSIPTVREEIGIRIKTYKDRISNHPSNLARQLMTGKSNSRRLKRKTPRDLIIN